MKLPYEIIAAHYNQKHSQIEIFRIKRIYVGVRIFEAAYNVTRADLIFRCQEAIELFCRENPLDRKMVEVHLVQVGEQEFFRLDDLALAEDKLGNLIEF